MEGSSLSRDISPAVLVSRFLRSNNYHKTLETFLQEANLPSSTGEASPNALTLETVLHEKNMFDISQSFEKTNFQDASASWSPGAPCKPSKVRLQNDTTNVLNVCVSSDIASRFLVVTTAGKMLHKMSLHTPFPNLSSSLPPNDSPVLACTTVRDRFLIWTSMSGQMSLFDYESESVVDTRRDHQKFVISVASDHDEGGVWVATAAWDSSVLVYRLDLSGDSSSQIEIGAPVARLHLPTNPMSLLLARHPDGDEPVLILSRRDSTILEYYLLPHSHATQQSQESPPALHLLGKQNLAPHSNAWVAFTPACVAPCPTNSSLVAIATSHVPHMKIIIAKLLFPPLPFTSTDPDVSGKQSDSSRIASETPAHVAVARRNLAIQDREAAAIQIQTNTMAPQTPYSTPTVEWRPDGTGVWVNGDDGVVRGIEAASGKVVATLKDGHDPGSKVRCLCSVSVPADKEGHDKEWLFSGGFDRRLIAWEA